MFVDVLLFIGALAAVCTAFTLYSDKNDLVILSGTLGFVAWGLFGFSAFEVEAPVGGSGGEVVRSYPELALLAFGLAAITAYPALVGPVELFADKTEEVR